MANKISNVSYDQIPHIVINHPDLNCQHWAIIIVLYKVLKDFPSCLYTNQEISKKTKISLRTVERRISELKKQGVISTKGISYNRRIKLGLLFNTTAIMADKNSTPPPKETPLTAKSDVSNRHHGGYSNISTKHIIKDTPCFSSVSLSQEERQEISHCMKTGNPLSESYRYLQEHLEKAEDNAKKSAALLSRVQGMGKVNEDG
jgi:DNA-binding Lrp family transcriptional regulator